MKSCLLLLCLMDMTMLFQADFDTTMEEESRSGALTKSTSEEDQRLKNAATIGTALMLVNSHRALSFL